jgi:Cu/Ag efflux protein CusF
MTDTCTHTNWQLSSDWSHTDLSVTAVLLQALLKKHFQGITMTYFLKTTLSALALMLGMATASAQTASADGVIRKLDLEAQRVLIKHGDWQGVSMMAMTMAFQVREKDLLKELNVNDTVHFSMEQDGRNWVITRIARIEPAVAEN